MFSVFVSHSSEDIEYAKTLRELLVLIGISNDDIFISSIPGNGIKDQISQEIIAALKTSKLNIIIYSDHYLSSSYCRNEEGIVYYQKQMGKEFIPVCVPDFDYKSLNGIITDDHKLFSLSSESTVGHINDIVFQTFQKQLKSESLSFATMEFVDKIKIIKPIIVKQQLNQQELRLTDDELILLFYAYKNKNRRIVEAEVQKWAFESELSNFDLKSGIDLLSKEKDLVDYEHALPFDSNIDIEPNYFKSLMLDHDKVTPLEKAFDSHISKRSIPFESAIQKAPDDVRDLIIFSCMNHQYKLGTRSLRNGTLYELKQWAGRMGSELTLDYDKCLNWLIENDFVYPSEYTSANNPRQYCFYPSIIDFLNKTENLCL